MKVSLDIKLEPKHLFNFNIKQAYKGVQGALSIILPILIFSYGFMSIGKVEIIYTAMYFVLGLVFLLYVPVSLHRRSNAVIKDEKNALSKILHYEFKEEEIQVTVGEESVTFKWENIFLLRTSGDLILIYTNRINAYILPMDQVGEQYGAFYELAKKQLEHYRFKMKKPESVKA